MKKFLTALLCACTAALSAFGFTACGGGENAGLTVVMPDGAPALSMVMLMSEKPDLGKEVNYRVVGASEISSFVTNVDESKNADLCVIPVNSASKLLGSGEKYMMLGTVTHGNLFIAANMQAEDLTPENFAEVIGGKKVGVVNLPAFPGAVFKLILDNYNVRDKVTLENVEATAVSGIEARYDYFVIPEPAASTRAGNEKLNLKIAGSLQQLYGEGGYPQAVLVAKKSLIESDKAFIDKFMLEMQSAVTWLSAESTSPQTVISAIKAHFPDPENTAPTFNANNLTKGVIANCAVNFVKSADCKDGVTQILNKLKAAGDGAATEVSPQFFYLG